MKHLQTNRLLLCIITHFIASLCLAQKGWYSITPPAADGSHHHVITTENHEPLLPETQEAAGYFFAEHCPHCNPESQTPFTRTGTPSYELWQSPVPCFSNLQESIQQTLNQKTVHVHFNSSAHTLTQHSQQIDPTPAGIAYGQTKTTTITTNPTPGNVFSFNANSTNYQSGSAGSGSSASVNINIRPAGGHSGNLQEQSLQNSSTQYAQAHMQHQIQTAAQDIQNFMNHLQQGSSHSTPVYEAPEIIPPAPKTLPELAQTLCGPQISERVTQEINKYMCGVYPQTRQNHHILNTIILQEAVRLGRTNSNGILPCFTEHPWIKYAKLFPTTKDDQMLLNYLLLSYNLGYEHQDSRLIVADRMLSAWYNQKQTPDHDEKNIYEHAKSHTQDALYKQKDLPHTTHIADDMLVCKEEWQNVIDELQNVVYQPILYNRLQALDQDQNNPSYKEKKQYILPVEVKSFLLMHGVGAGAYEFLEGSHLQHQLHREVIDIATSSYLLSNNALVRSKCPDFSTTVTQLCSASLQANQATQVAQAAQLNDCSYAWIQYANDIAQGIALGINDLKQIVQHPITTVINTAKAIGCIAYLSKKVMDHTIKIAAGALPAACGFRTAEFLQNAKTYLDVFMHLKDSVQEGFKHLNSSIALTESSRFLTSILIPTFGLKALQTTCKVALPLALKLADYTAAHYKTLPSFAVRAAGVMEPLVATTAELQESLHAIGQSTAPLLPELRPAALYENPEYLQSVLAHMKDVSQVTKFTDTTKNFTDLSMLHESQQTYLKYMAQLYDSIGAEMKALSQEAVTFTTETGEIYHVKEWTMWHPHVGEMPLKFNPKSQISGAHFDYNNIYSKLYDVETTKSVGNGLVDANFYFKGLANISRAKPSSLVLNAPRPDIILQDVIYVLKNAKIIQTSPAKNGIKISFTIDSKKIYQAAFNTSIGKISTYYQIPSLS